MNKFAAYKQRDRQRRAFSLIEVCVSIVILASIFASLLIIFSQGNRYLRKLRDRTTAAMLLQGEMEKRLTPGLLSFSNGLPEAVTVNTVFDAPFTRFNYTISVSDTDVVTGLSLRQVNGTIYWQGEQGDINFRIETLAYYNTT